MAYVKCRIRTCHRLVGPLRQKISDLCYQCDLNIEKWSKRSYNDRVEWYRRVNMFVERQEVLPKGQVSDDQVKDYVHKIVTAAMRKKEKRK